MRTVTGACKASTSADLQGLPVGLPLGRLSLSSFMIANGLFNSKKVHLGKLEHSNEYLYTIGRNEAIANLVEKFWPILRCDAIHEVGETGLAMGGFHPSSSSDPYASQSCFLVGKSSRPHDATIRTG